MFNCDAKCAVSCAWSCRDLSVNPNVGMKGENAKLLKEVTCQMQACHKVTLLEELSNFSDFRDFSYLFVFKRCLS